LIVAGGADTYDRLAEGIESGFVSAVTTAHRFNVMGDGLKDARMELMKSGIALSEWNFEELQNAYPG
jgi:cyclase